MRILMFGDFDQNIYLWRGAKFSRIQDFLKDYDVVHKELKYTYRLGSNVNKVAQKLISSHQGYQTFR